jgi:hypothetical protein
MQDFLVYGISAFLVCFTVLTFCFSRIPDDEFPEYYEFKLDPFWYLWTALSLGGIGIYILFPEQYDNIIQTGWFGTVLPFIFAGGIYIGYLSGSTFFANTLIALFSLIISLMQPDTFQLFPEQLALWQDRIVVALLLFIVSKGLGLLNGLPAVASLQFLTVTVVITLLTYFGALPQILGAFALTYAGSMIAFSFFSWPPERLVISVGGFSSLGFILGCLMLSAAGEYAEVSMFVAASYLFTEVGIALYNRFIANMHEDHPFMYTSYFQISKDGEYTSGVLVGIIKIFALNIVLSVIQIAGTERLAFPVFSVALNLWYLSILSGQSEAQPFFSITRIGFNIVKGVFSKKKKDDKE